MSNTDGQATSTGTATSRVGQVRKAVRRQTHARLALSGPSGSGKTWTSLWIARAIAPDRPTIVIDTEPGDGAQGAAELYADQFDFETIQWDPPYDPRDLTLTIRELGAVPANVGGVLIIDSASAFWKGAGGTLDIAGGRFGGWRTADPVQNDLIDAILRSSMHVICCTRAKQAYEAEMGADGKQTVRKLGLAPIQRDDLEYEFQVVGMIDTEHRLDIGKTRAAPLAGLSFAANQQDRFATIYGEWLAAGAHLARRIEVDAVGIAVRILPPGDARSRVATHLRDTFGPAASLTEDVMGAVWLYLAEALSVEPHRFTQGDDDVLCASCGVPTEARWHDDNLDDGPARTDPKADALDRGEPMPASGDDGVGMAQDPGGEMPDDDHEEQVGADGLEDDGDPRRWRCSACQSVMAAPQCLLSNGQACCPTCPNAPFMDLVTEQVEAQTLGLDTEDGGTADAEPMIDQGYGPNNVRRDDRIAEVIEDVKALTPALIAAGLTGHGKSTTGTLPTLSARLCAAILAAEGIDVTQGDVKDEVRR